MQTAANTSSAAVLRFFSLSTQSWIMQEGLLRLSMTLEVQGGMSSSYSLRRDFPVLLEGTTSRTLGVIHCNLSRPKLISSTGRVLFLLDTRGGFF